MERIKIIKNGDAVRHTFSAAEYERRQSALRNLMREEKVDFAVLTSIHNINYFSDFLYCSFGRPYALIVTDSEVTSVSANIDGGQPARRTVGGNVVYTDWQRDNFFYAVAKTAPKRGVVGIETDHISVENMEKLRAALPECSFQDIGKSAMRMRMIKSDEEAEHIKQGAQVCNVGARALIAAVADGAPEHELALESTRAMVREIANRFPHGELMDTWTWLQSGINTDGAHNPVTTRRIGKGDILSLNCFSMIAGYYVALERTMFCDHADDASLKIWEINVAVHEAGMRLLKPGARCCDIARELNKIYESHGLLESRTFGYGHSFGVLCHYYGREAGLELREDVETVLRPNMIVSMEPMLMIPEGQPGAGGYREHDIFVITETGAENITNFPYGPEHLIIRNGG